MQTLIKVLMTSFLFLSSPLYAGGSWSSGGGEILEHAQNPWFIDIGQPQKPVSYCVVASSDFPLGIATLKQLVDQSFHWWNGQFSNAHLTINKIYTQANGAQDLAVGANHKKIYKEVCTRDVDLAFQFGYLEPYQIEEFQKVNVDLTKHVALTIRTDYDEKLRGKGFIYVSPDRGPNAFKGQNIVENAWTEANDYNYSRLRSVLLHEIGHVFGLQHGANNDTIMSSKLAEDAVSKSSYTHYSVMQQAVFFPKSTKLNHTFCNDDSDANSDPDAFKNFRKFFQVPVEDECVRVFMDLNQLVIRSGRKSFQGQWQEIGRAKFESKAVRKSQLVSIWLPPNQTLFPDLTWPRVLLGAASVEIQQPAVFRYQVTQEIAPLFIQASPRHIQIGGVVDGKMVPDLLPKGEYNSSLSGWEYK